MTTGGTPPGDGSHNPYGDSSGPPDWNQQPGGYGQDPYPGQGYGQDPYPGQGYEQPGYGHQYSAPGYGAAHPQQGVSGGVMATGPISAPDAVSTAWQLFKNNPLPWVLITLALGVASFLVSMISNSDSSGVATLGTILTLIVSFVFQAFIVRGALLEVDGHKPEIGDFFKLHNFGWFVVAGIIVSIAVAIGTILLIIPGLVVGFFTYWTFNFVVDRNMTATDAIRSSFNAIKTDGGNLFLLAVLNVLITIAGFFALVVGLLVALPIATLASMVAYRAITGPSDFSQVATSGV